MAEINYAFGDYRTNVTLEELADAVSGEVSVEDVDGLQDALDAKADATDVVAPRTTYAFSKAGVLAVAAGTQRLYNDTGRTLTLVSVRASAGTGPAGAALTVDVHKNGTTIFTTQANRPSIAAAAVTGTSGVVQVASWANGEYLTIDIDQVGSGVPGSDLTVTVVAEG